MPNIGAPELIIILVIALLVLGPGKLPEVGASIGKSLREFRKASSDVQEATKIDLSVTPTPPAAPLAAAPLAAAPLATETVTPGVVATPDAGAIAAARATLAAAEAAGATESPAVSPDSESTATTN